ncbi:bacillithiol system redox-active protein YtxJ [Fictibacillus nanhaiensis]|uniref:bacillithiol system redox-active protein YtxJ n=1 Tax=Fictibacillus nanhaiensis TaxID=742169 RepID=UPI001C960874|nr:bacillithiol system redox-active protein YtxJ [Fictibacillus nanhaiensis]MBY6035159.1 bacillithiol system redox-active protein YtxJ [Fictibacillus nanhaiensis]
MSLIQLHNEQDWNLVKEQKTHIVLMKNSTTCPVSHEAFKQYQKFASENDKETFYYLNVQDSRPLSNLIAEESGVKHESPQVLIFQGNTVVWHDSHWNITNKKLTEANEKTKA